MRVGFKSEHWRDTNGNPAGGSTFGNGFAITWQNGPLGRHTEECSPLICSNKCTRREPNGAFVEDIIAAAVDRLEFYQDSRFKCMENAAALESLRVALNILEARTNNRETRKVEGTHAV